MATEKTWFQFDTENSQFTEKSLLMIGMIRNYTITLVVVLDEEWEKEYTRQTLEEYLTDEAEKDTEKEEALEEFLKKNTDAILIFQEEFKALKQECRKSWKVNDKWLLLVKKRTSNEPYIAVHQVFTAMNKNKEAPWYIQ